MKLIAIILSLLAFNVNAQTYGFSLGQTKLETPFEHSRFAFPDMAQGGPGCCDLTYSEESSLPAFRLTVSDRISGAWGYEGAFSYLGKSRVSFNVSGPFGGSLQGPVTGSCVESGDFTMSGLSLAGTYTRPVLGALVFGKLGMSGNLLRIKTQSSCQLVTQVDISQDTTRFSMSPLVGAGVRKSIGGGYSLVLDAEARRITFSANDEAKSYGQGKAMVLTAWVGVEKKF